MKNKKIGGNLNPPYKMALEPLTCLAIIISKANNGKDNVGFAKYQQIINHHYGFDDNRLTLRHIHKILREALYDYCYVVDRDFLHDLEHIIEDDFQRTVWFLKGTHNVVAFSDEYYEVMCICILHYFQNIQIFKLKNNRQRRTKYAIHNWSSACNTKPMFGEEFKLLNKVLSDFQKIGLKQKAYNERKGLVNFKKPKP